VTLESKEHLRNKVHSRLVRERKSAKEIQEILDSLKARPLEYAEYRAMPQDVASWHEFANSANVDKALEAHQDERRKAAEKTESDLKTKWEANATPEDFAAAQKAGEEFLSRYKHFIRDSANSCVMSDRMKLKNRNPQDVQSWIRTFEELAVEGLVFLNGKVAGISEDTVIGGHELRTHAQLHRLLQPTFTAAQLEQHAAAKMSADQWKASRPELQDGIPFIIQQQFFKAAHSLASFEPEYVFSDENNAKLIEYVTANKLQFNLTGLRVAFNAMKDQLETTSHKAHGQVVTLTEHDPQPHGAPALPDKASLRAKIRNLSSTQLAQYFADNPGARAAVDSL
jgi:hypothetical protein